VGDLLDPVKSSDVVKSINAGRQTAVKTENLVVDESSQGQVVKEVGEVFPHVGIAILAQTLVVKTIHLCDLTRLMIATEDGDALGVSNLESDQESDSLNGVVATVNVVTHKEIVCVWIRSPDLEEFHQVVELTVNIAAHSNGAFHWLHVRFLLEDFSGLFAESLHVSLAELLAVHKALDPAIKGANSGGLGAGGWRKVGGHSSDVFHVCVHYCWGWHVLAIMRLEAKAAGINLGASQVARLVDCPDSTGDVVLYVS